MVTKEAFIERYTESKPLFNEFEKLDERYEIALAEAAKYASGSLIGADDSESLGLKQNIKLKGASWTGKIIGVISGLIVFSIMVMIMGANGKTAIAAIVGIVVGVVISKIVNKLMLEKIMTKEVKKIDNRLDRLTPIVNDAVAVCEKINKTMRDVPLMYCYPFALKSFFELFKADRVDDTRAAIETYEKTCNLEGLNAEVAERLKDKMMNS